MAITAQLVIWWFLVTIAGWLIVDQDKA